MSDCTLLVPLDTIWLDHNVLNGIQNVQIDLNSTWDFTQITKLLASEAKCLVTIASFSTIETILSLAKPIPNHVTLYVDSRAPGEEISKINRPLVTIREGNIEVRAATI